MDWWIAFATKGYAASGRAESPRNWRDRRSFAKEFLQRHNIPTAQHATFTELAPALAYVRAHGAPIVIKADGLAAGKGVVVALTLADAEQALHDMLGAHALGRSVGARGDRGIS